MYLEVLSKGLRFINLSSINLIAAIIIISVYMSRTIPFLAFPHNIKS
jgi:branched-subunit amino acid transport protein AzlD